MAAWSFIAQRALTGEFLDWDVPLELDGLEWQLSGPGSLKGTVSPDVGGLRASDGRLLLEEWGTLLYAEHDGIIRWGGILISSSFSGEKWNIEAAGFSTYPHAIEYAGDYSQIGVDAATVIRHLWDHIQGYPSGNLGVQVIGAETTGHLLGDPGTSALQDAITKAVNEIIDRFEEEDVSDPSPDNWSWPDWGSFAALFGPDLNRQWKTEAPTVPALDWLKAYADTYRQRDPDPYTLNWYETTNCGEEIDSLVKEAGVDWHEEHAWTPDHESITHRIVLSHPRAGRRRDDLVFAQGDNVVSLVSVESNGDDYANEIVGLGAGEGRAMLRRTTAIQDGRLRVNHVLVDKAVTKAARMDALIGEEMNLRRAAIRVESVDVIDHPNAPIGSWQLGDDVLIRAEIPWLGEIEVWCRVTGWTLTGDNTATLSLVRSDLYRYGGVTQ